MPVSGGKRFEEHGARVLGRDGDIEPFEVCVDLGLLRQRLTRVVELLRRWRRRCGPPRARNGHERPYQGDEQEQRRGTEYEESSVHDPLHPLEDLVEEAEQHRLHRVPVARVHGKQGHGLRQPQLGPRVAQALELIGVDLVRGDHERHV